MSKYRLLISYAHPDDESFGSGGLIAKYVAEGADVYYICATNGEMGTIPETMQAQYNAVADIRLAELDCAAHKLGLQQVIRLDYKDSGMMGAESNNDPECLWYQWKHNPEQVTKRIVEVIRDVQPQVVLTFNRYGGYGHPDHIAIQQATTQAVELAGDSAYVTGQSPYAPQKLYYSAIPGKFLKFTLLLMRLRGHDVRHMGVNGDIDFQAVIEHIEPVHTLVDVAPYLDVWDAAAACHQSQGGGRGSGTRGFISRLPLWLRRLLTGRQAVTRVYPAPTHNQVDEYDLFANVTLEQPIPDQV